MEIDIAFVEQLGLSIFLAKFFGLYFLIICLMFLLRKNTLNNLIDRMLEDNGLLALSGFISLLIGVGVVVSHSIFISSWRILITLIGYIALIKGILRIAFPEKSKQLLRKIMGKAPWAITLVVMWIVTIVLLFYGFVF